MCIKLVHVTDIRNQGPEMWNWDGVFPIMQAVFCIIQGFLPGFILKLFTMVIPYLVTCFSAIEGHVSLSRLETTAATKFYYFVVINVFFGSILTGSAFSELQLFVGQSSLVG
jgi:hypothetical protein